MNQSDLQENKDNMKEAIDAALTAYSKFASQCPKTEHMLVINFREPSYRKRMALIRLVDKDIHPDGTQIVEIVSYHHVAHGSGSAGRDKSFAVQFSNVNNSHMSSLGAMVTAETYRGKYGYSCRLDGLDKGVNDNVRRRVMVIHPAPYVTDDYILKNGRCGCTWGCFGIDPSISKNLMDKISGGCFLYSYY